MNSVISSERQSQQFEYPPTIAIEGNSAYLRLTTEADAEELYATLDANREHLEKYQHFQLAGITPESVKEIVKRTVASIRDGSRLQYRIIKDEHLIGNVNFYELDKELGTANLAYWLAKDQQGKGIAYAASRSLVDYGFNGLGLKKIKLEIVPSNIRSEHLARRLGAKLLDKDTRIEMVGDRKYEYRMWEIKRG